jgi:uncharacterized protein (DUF2225 family)
MAHQKDFKESSMAFLNRRIFRAWLWAAAVLPLVAAPRSATALTLYETEVTCPVDGRPFKATLVGSYKSTGTRLDLKPVGDMIAPYRYPVCPGNGFVVYQNEFSGDEIAAIRSIAASDEFKSVRRGHTDHAVVAYVKQRLGAKDFDVAESYLQASWEAERDRPQLVDEYRARALAAFDAARERGDLSPDDRRTAMVVGAELERLLGDFNAAAARLSGLIQELAADGSGKNAALMMAAEQIAQHAANRSAQPQILSDQTSTGTVGSGAR